MGIHVIREATAQDIARASDAAVKFATRYGIPLWSDCPLADVEGHLSGLVSDGDYSAKRLSYIFSKRLGRALDLPASINLTIAYGHVGRSAGTR